jgi:hypothetical protein
MTPHALREHYLVDELQLGQTLNQAISQGRRSEFSLLLAMLSPDVEDQPWVADAIPADTTSIDWRRRFELPKVKPLEAHVQSADRAMAMAAQLTQGGLAAVHLQECLEPEPLTLKQFQFDSEVWNNLSPLAQEKHRFYVQGEPILRDPMTDKPTAMLDTIHDSCAIPELKVRYFDEVRRAS